MNVDPFNPESEFKKFHHDLRESYNFEIRQKRPSKYLLERFAEKILATANAWQSMNQYQQAEVVTVRLSIDIFSADLRSDLAENNDEKYRKIWDVKYSKLKSIQNEFVKGYMEYRKIIVQATAGNTR